jgi:hypothetical protein
MAGLLAVGVAVAGCGGDGDSGADQADGDATGAPAIEATAAGDGAEATGRNAGLDGADAATASMTLGDEAITMEGLRCFFEEQPRAGLGGVFTHSAQGQGINAAGESVILDLTRARAEDGTVQDEIIVDIGDPAGGDSVSLGASGPEGLITFGEASASATGVEVSDFGADPITLAFDLACR